jgi:hypothetical protein
MQVGEKTLCGVDTQPALRHKSSVKPKKVQPKERKANEKR